MKFTLRALRVNQGLKLEEASKLIGVAITTLSKWENGKTSPGLKYIPILEKLYNCTYDDIIFFKK